MKFFKKWYSFKRICHRESPFVSCGCRCYCEHRRRLVPGQLDTSALAESATHPDGWPSRPSAGLFGKATAPVSLGLFDKFLLFQMFSC